MVPVSGYDCVVGIWFHCRVVVVWSDWDCVVGLLLRCESVVGLTPLILSVVNTILLVSAYILVHTYRVCL